MPRLFFAVWPDAQVRSQLAEYSAKCEWPQQARPVAAADFHLTLRFIGDADMHLRNTLRRSLKLDFDPFDVELGQPELWKGEVAVLRPSTDSAALTALHDSLEDKLAGLGLTEQERSYRPHVALARHAKHSHLPEPGAMAWHVTTFCLAESAPSPSGRYRILQTYLARQA